MAVRPGTRVRLRPRPGADVFDIALAGRTAVVEEVVENMEGQVQLAVSVDDDPGRDLGQYGHRFFFGPEEVEPLPRVLVAGIGNVFLGDDGFGVAVAEALAASEWPDGVHVEDFGIRGMDLAYALAGYDVAILVDAVPRGGAPGTLYVIEPELGDDEVGVDAHGMNPVAVLALARTLGGPLPRVLVVGCEPATRMTGEEDEVVAELSEPVRAAVGEAVRMVESLVVEETT
ncbi:MAG TPA: hydrogenase maturation protease [Thermoleophilaceae bacterium]|nr:hydrogenase maturation protease [Thermoleophilaceae bacterium]